MGPYKRIQIQKAQSYHNGSQLLIPIMVTKSLLSTPFYDIGGLLDYSPLSTPLWILEKCCHEWLSECFV
jgi:hypothetical protein